MNKVLARTATVLALIGLAISSYLTYVHYEKLTPLCVGGGVGCEIVQSSVYSKLLGIPVVLIGMIGYTLILTIIWARPLQQHRSTLLLVTTGLGFAFSLYLSYIGLIVIGHTCIWCLSSAAVMTALFILAGANWVNDDSNAK